MLQHRLQNKRAVVIIDSPQFGPVAVICIGATMVGSIEFTAVEGRTYSKVRLAAAIHCTRHYLTHRVFDSIPDGTARSCNVAACFSLPYRRRLFPPMAP